MKPSTPAMSRVTQEIKQTGGIKAKTTNGGFRRQVFFVLTSDIKIIYKVATDMSDIFCLGLPILFLTFTVQ